MKLKKKVFGNALVLEVSVKFKEKKVDILIKKKISNQEKGCLIIYTDFLFFLLRLFLMFDNIS